MPRTAIASASVTPARRFSRLLLFVLMADRVGGPAACAVARLDEVAGGPTYARVAPSSIAAGLKTFEKS